MYVQGTSIEIKKLPQSHPCSMVVTGIGVVVGVGVSLQEKGGLPPKQTWLHAQIVPARCIPNLAHEHWLRFDHTTRKEVQYINQSIHTSKAGHPSSPSKTQ
jgi:hypothetical protein